jgi:hypothetical protein
VLADIGALVKTIFRHGTSWLAWGTDVDVVRAPIANDTLGRIVYTGYGKPKFTDATLALSAPPYPTASMDLSLPRPTSAPSVDTNRTQSATIWSDSTVFSADDLVFPGDGFAYQTTVDGTSGTSAPAWPGVLGATVTDNNLTWTCIMVVGTGSQKWFAETDVTMGHLVEAGDYLLRCVTAGTTGSTLPTSGTSPTSGGMWLGNTFSDGTVSWYVERVISSGARYLNHFRNRYVKIGDVFEVLYDGYTVGGGNHFLWHSYKVVTSGVTASTFNPAAGVVYDKHAEYHFHINNMQDGGAVLAPITFSDNSHSIYYNLIRTTAVSKEWSAATAFSNGECIIVDGHVYGCLTPGTTAGSKGPWTQTPGQTVADGTVTWQCMWSARFDTAAGREASTWYALGAVQTMDGFNYVARSAGRTGTETPRWPVTIGGTVQDGDVLWECIVFSGLADQEDVVYVETFVRRYAEIDEESLPSPVSAMRTVQFSTGQTVRLTGLNLPAGSSHGITHRRLYRLTQGVTTSEYFFLAELPIATVDYTDSTPSDKLAGDVLLSAEWDGAPDGLAGLVIMPGGILCGFVGKEVCFSEPYQYHAWPYAYRITVEDAVVALGVFGNSLLVATQGTPYVITGARPGYMSVDRLEVNEACLSKRGLVDLGSAIAYPSPNGLVVIGRGINKVVTAQTHRIADWQALIPDTFVGFCHRGRYFAFYNNGTAGLLSIDLSGAVEFFSPIADAVWADQLTGEVWMCQGLNILKFNAGAALSLSWSSVPFITTYPQSLSVGQVRAKTYPCTLVLKGDGSTIHTQTVADAQPFRLPAKRALSFDFTVSGSVEIENVILAGSMADLGGR